MYIASHTKTAVRNLLASKMRAFLAMLSIIVGTASVVALVSSGQLATETALTQFKALGTNLMSISFEPEKGQKQANDRLNLSVMKQIPEIIPDIIQIAPFLAIYPPVSFKEQTWNNIVIAATPSLADIINIRMAHGRFLMPIDAASPYCVLGKNVAASLNTLSPTGKRIKLGHAIFTIIGVVSDWPENNFFAQDINQVIIVPVQTVNSITDDAQLTDAVMKLSPSADIAFVKNALISFIKKNAPGYLISLQSAQEMVLRMAAQQQIFTLLLGLIGGIALFVGGIGVMNIMLASVTERQNEIGLRLALGAQPKDIQIMFLVEALVLALAGGILGVILGLSATVIIAKIAGWTFIFFMMPPILGLTVSIVVSIFFGFYPAYKASKLNPIEALWRV